MDCDFWNHRYAEPGFAYGTAPNAFLASLVLGIQPYAGSAPAPSPRRSLIRPGMRALAIADGEGRNGVWLAQQGLAVLSVDASDVGMGKARELARERKVELRTETADLFGWAWPDAEFDIVVAIFAHFPPGERARMHASMLRALVPGGVLILEAFAPKQLEYRSGGPRMPEMLYSVEHLRADFSGAQILMLEETLTELDEGPYHRGEAAVIRLVARRCP